MTRDILPDVQYYWARDYFPNFVEEDRRTMVSFDGNLYFSYLDYIDIGHYSCNVKSTVSGIGKNGPIFNLEVNPHRKLYLCIQRYRISLAINV